MKLDPGDKVQLFISDILNPFYRLTLDSKCQGEKGEIK